ncbi:MAG: hypothetical protein IKV55_04225, partial [Oscillospiraceae bacterium]|nr:hypothetical protein [Oscillospiraceae bacterium]
MNEQATAMLTGIIDKAEETFRAAERSFEIEGDAIERRSQRMSVWGGSVQDNLDLLHDSRRICHELYSSHEAVIAALDAQARAYLYQDVDGALVVRIAELIEEINGESRNLGANYNVSVDGYSAGSAVMSYQPSTGAMAAELFWKTQADMLPDAAEARSRHRAWVQAKLDAEYERERQRLERERQKKEAVRNELEAGQRAQAKKKAYFERADRYDEALENYLYNVQMTLRSRELQTQVETLTGEIAKLQQKRSSLGLFDREGREAVRAQIEQLEKMKTQMQSHTAYDAYEKRMLRAIETEVARYRAEIEAFLRKRFPYGEARLAYIQNYIAEHGLFASSTSMAAQRAAMRVLIEQGSMRPEQIPAYDPRFSQMDGSDMRKLMNTAFRNGNGPINRRRLENTAQD